MGNLKSLIESGKLVEGILSTISEASGYPKGFQQFMEDMRAEGTSANPFRGSIGASKKVRAQSTDKTWDDGVPVTKYFTRGGYKDVALPKGEFWVIETPNFWYIRNKATWIAVSRDRDTPPFNI